MIFLTFDNWANLCRLLWRLLGHFRTLPIKTPLSVGWVVKTAFYVSIGTHWVRQFYSKIKPVFWYFPDFGRQLCCFTVRKFRRFCQNCIRWVHGNYLEREFFFEKKIMFFHQYRTLRAKVWAFFQNFSPFSSKLHSTCQEERFKFLKYS